MSYKYYQQSTDPLNCWIMDNATPFLDVSGNGGVANTKSGTSNPTKSTPLVAGAAWSSVFSSASVGEFTTSIFQQGLEERSWAMAVWILPIPKTTTGIQAILSHTGQTDGLTINGNTIRFSTDYLTTGSAAVTYDLQIARGAFVVCKHDFASNELWINGELVAQIDITNEQQNDNFVATTNKLYCGTTSSTQQIAINGVAFYSGLTSEGIQSLYKAGIDVTPQAKTAPQLGGMVLNMNRDYGSLFVDATWQDTDDFTASALINNVNVMDMITPVLDATDTSQAGTWTTALPLDALGITSIYGAMIDWSGAGFTVDVSLDGTTWSSATKGQLVSVITNGMDPTGKDLHIRVSFAGGIVDDPSYLDSLRVVGFIDNTFANITGRAVTVSSPAVLRDDYEPILYRDDNGVSLHGGTLTIGTDTSLDPRAARTLEVWLKVLSGTPTISVGGTKYRNGVADSTLPVGEWTCIHYVAAADITTSITITGDVIVGQASIYATALTAAQVLYLFQSYTGKPVIAINDSSAIAMSEPGSPANLYTHDWSIDGGGG